MFFPLSRDQKIGFVDRQGGGLISQIAIARSLHMKLDNFDKALAQGLVGILALEIEKAAVAKSGMRDPVPVPVRGLVEFSHIDEGCEDLDGKTQCAGLHEIDQIRVWNLPFGNGFLKGEMALYETQHGRPV